MPFIHAPSRDLATEVFDAIAQARRGAPGAGLPCRVAVRSRTGQLMATFLLDNPQQLHSFEERMLSLGYRMADHEAGGCLRFDFSLDRRAANGSLHAPHRRKDDAGEPLAH